MTDKQIIIDGVDVSGCEKQGETINGITCGKGERIRLANEIITKHKLCKDSPNCYYKQLKRKEQECEELKEKYLELKEQNGSNIVRLNTVNEQLDQLKAENERLEAHSATLDAVIESGKVQYKALKQTLTEIKEIAEDESYIGFWDEQISEILQKISEVEK